MSPFELNVQLFMILVSWPLFYCTNYIVQYKSKWTGIFCLWEGGHHGKHLVLCHFCSLFDWCFVILTLWHFLHKIFSDIFVSVVIFCIISIMSEMLLILLVGFKSERSYFSLNDPPPPPTHTHSYQAMGLVLFFIQIMGDIKCHQAWKLIFVQIKAGPKEPCNLWFSNIIK